MLSPLTERLESLVRRMCACGQAGITTTSRSVVRERLCGLMANGRGGGGDSGGGSSIEKSVA